MACHPGNSGTLEGPRTIVRLISEGAILLNGMFCKETQAKKHPKQN
jgi:hypothetical protein